MELIGCGRGHFYDPNEHASCPQCAKENNMDFLSVTDPVNFDGYASKTEPAGNFGYGMNVGFGQTEPADDFLKTSNFASGYSAVESYTPTAPVTPAVSESSSVKPVVGWLVCVDGAAKGRDFRIHAQYNYIGRGRHMDICISGDDCISTERAAIIAYDTEEKFFSFGPGMGHNVVRVNGKMLMNAVVLQPYDELTIGKTKLLFVPLCGERFDWNDK